MGRDGTFVTSGDNDGLRNAQCIARRHHFLCGVGAPRMCSAVRVTLRSADSVHRALKTIRSRAGLCGGKSCVPDG
jgi:hypothetical protein